MKNGQISLYLDIYPNKVRWYEFLDIHIQKNKASSDDKENKNLALQIKTKWEHDLIVEDNSLQDRKKKMSRFLTFCVDYYNEKANSGPCSRLQKHIEVFVGKKPLTFVQITNIWIKEFQKYLLTKVSHNTALNTIAILKCVLTEAIRQMIISRHPWMDLSTKEMLRKKDVFRQAFTPEQLQHLSDTFPRKKEPQIRLGYLFAGCTGFAAMIRYKVLPHRMNYKGFWQRRQFHRYYTQNVKYNNRGRPNLMSRLGRKHFPGSHKALCYLAANFINAKYIKEGLLRFVQKK